MNQRSTEVIAAIGLLIGGLFGLAGSFAPSDSLRCLFWGVDGVGLVLACALLTVYYFRKGEDMTASGYLIFAVGEGCILASSGMDLYANSQIFAAGTSLWSAALFVISFQKTYPLLIRVSGIIAAILFAIVSIQIFSGIPLNALTKPLPFNAYPVFVITIFGWAWMLLRKLST